MGWSRSAREAAARARHLKHPLGALPTHPAIPKYRRDRLLQAHRHLKLPKNLHNPILNAIIVPPSSNGKAIETPSDQHIAEALKAAARAEHHLRTHPGSYKSVIGQPDAQKRMINHLERYQAFLKDLKQAKREHRYAGNYIPPSESSLKKQPWFKRLSHDAKLAYLYPELSPADRRKSNAAELARKARKEMKARARANPAF